MKNGKPGRVTKSLTKFKKWRVKKKLESFEAKLEKLIENLAKKGEVNQGFFDFVRDCLNSTQQPKFWKKVLRRGDLSPFQLYDISIMANDEMSRTRAQQRFLKEENIDNLCEDFEETDKDYQQKIFEEICKRIKFKWVKKAKIWKLLTDIIKNKHLPLEYREKSLELLEYQDAPDSEFKNLLDIPTSISDPDLIKLQKKIQVFISERSKKKKKNFNATLFNEIKTTMEKITQLKQLQKLE